jgi:hypothetical protein
MNLEEMANRENQETSGPCFDFGPIRRWGWDRGV